jgi:hypothetical protein
LEFLRKIAMVVVFMLCLNCIAIAEEITDFYDTSIDYMFNYKNYIFSGRIIGLGMTTIVLPDETSMFYSNPCCLVGKDKSSVYFTTEGINKDMGIGYIRSKESYSLGINMMQSPITIIDQIDHKDNSMIESGSIIAGFSITPKLNIGINAGGIGKNRRVDYNVLISSNMDSASEGGYGIFYNIGMSYELNQNTSIGLTYNSSNRIEWTSPTSTNNVTGVDVLPSSIGIGIASKISKSILLVGDVIYKRLSDIQRVENGNTVISGLADTIEPHIGIEYSLGDKMSLRTGMYSKTNIESLNTISQSIFTLGAGYAFKSGTKIDLGVQNILSNRKDTESAMSTKLSLVHTFGLSKGLDREGKGLKSYEIYLLDLKYSIIDLSFFHYISLFSNSTSIIGMDVGLLSTKAYNVYGMQLSGCYSEANDCYGFQFSAYNKASTVYGIQCGYVNYAENLKGVQLGLVNIAKNSLVPTMIGINVGW